MNGVGVKKEEEPTFKLEMDLYAGPALDDDDAYEDTGELTIPESQALWLTRVPDYLWEALSGLNDDDEIEIGKVRIWEQGGQEKVKLDLDDRKEFQEVPKAYDLPIINNDLKNTFLFSEKNQPGYKASGLGQKRSLLGVGSDGGPDSKRRKPFANSIPKQTALVGFGKHEVNCLAVENAEYRRLMDERMRKLFQPKHTTTFLQPDQADEARLLQNSQKTKLEKFIVPVSSKPKKPQENKNVRIAAQELIPWLIDLFSEYKYWPLKQLRHRTKQPEAFLKETLGEIGYMVKSGPFAMLWTLREEYITRLPATVKEERPPEEEMGDDEDEEEELKMEDVNI
ncbi:MAG: hypothetical protein M1822_000114 [Bathelium mastoideum]|nr:MAG: hypothetical protein M1822_000114 [Bathelium mastoideum]